MSIGLPAGWAAARIGDLAELNPKQVFDDDTVAGFVPMSLAPTNFREKLRFDKRPWGEIKKAYTNFKDGDVIFAKVTPCFENGKAALVEGLPNGIGAGSSEFFVLRPSCNEVSAKYLLALIKSYDFLREGAENMTGAVGLRRVPKQFVENYDVLVPPAAEQKRIAAKLDELLTQVEILKARIDGIPALLKRFRQSVLDAGVSGRLTEDWRRDQTGIDSQYDADGLPLGWSVVPLGRYVVNHDGARKPISSKERESRIGDNPYFGATGQIDCIDGYTHDGEFVLVGEDGANLLTRVKPLAFTVKGQVWVNNHAHVIASPLGHSNAYLAIYLNTLDITQWVSGSAQPKLNQKNMNEIPVHVPLATEQLEIVRCVENLFAIANQLEAKLALAQSRIDHLAHSILAKAFRGELVPQDPKDEPAIALLERIKAQRASAPKTKRSRRSATAR
ncbi:restriction endonuclease subunit S [Pseudomonas sp. NBRC 111123]|uniref:restriction endonuclease subunit S n=1 Tax=Pseudomonas sp. NBRC 111123 TaxID=1661038 RepID=UPI000760CFC6|nr:restriction endonuclease subunit S [Pseudomonas sp. NBRC 111123]